MNRFYILLIQLSTVSLYSNHARSQEIILRTNSVDTIHVNSMYKYPDFLNGTLNYRDGSSATSRFNVNMLLDEIQFISLKGDTLLLADKNEIDNIVIGDRKYYYNKGAIEVVKNSRPVQLGINRKIVAKIRNQRGAYGESLETTSIANTNQLIYNNQFFTLEGNKDVLLTKTVEYYFIKEDKSMVLPATKNNLYKVLREHNQKALSDYLSENKINFKKEEDLCKLLAFCEQFAQDK